MIKTFANHIQYTEYMRDTHEENEKTSNTTGADKISKKWLKWKENFAPEGQAIILLSWGHTFHSLCLSQSEGEKNQCPHCTKQLEPFFHRSKSRVMSKSQTSSPKKATNKFNSSNPSSLQEDFTDKKSHRSSKKRGKREPTDSEESSVENSNRDGSQNNSSYNKDSTPDRHHLPSIHRPRNAPRESSSSSEQSDVSDSNDPS